MKALVLAAVLPVVWSCASTAPFVSVEAPGYSDPVMPTQLPPPEINHELLDATPKYAAAPPCEVLAENPIDHTKTAIPCGGPIAGAPIGLDPASAPVVPPPVQRIDLNITSIP